MRSRDGNFCLSLAILLTLATLFSILDADEYLISYRYVIKDAIIYNEELSISKTMKKCFGKQYDSIILENNNSSNLKKVIAKNNISFIDFIHKIGLNVEHRAETINLLNHSTTILTLKTTCFKVDFNDNFVKISPLK